MTSIRRSLHTVAALAAMLVSFAAFAHPASAADTYAPGVAAPFTCSGSMRGTMDAARSTYLACGSRIRIIRADGTSFERAVSGPGANQVAPSADGSHLYGINGSAVFRYRLSNGAYVHDTAWVPQLVGGRAPCGRGIATDVYGYVYVANGGWCTGNNQIVKYDSAGRIVTAFGDFAKTGAAGTFNVDMDVAVTSDGRRIYVADHLNTRVQYFDWQFSGAYRHAGSFSLPSATYDVKLDPWGYVYAASTTEGDVRKFTADGALIGRIVNETSSVLHNVAVDARGWVYAGEFGRVYRRTADNPVPGPLPAHRPMPRTDTRDPQVISVGAPAETTEGAVQVTVAAQDPDGNEIVRMRIADESGDFRAWTSWTPSFRYELSAGLGSKDIYVQVEDAAGRISAAARATIRRIPVPDLADPVVTITAPASSFASTIQLGIDASDDIAVTHIRFASEEGTFGEWQPWSSGATTVQHALTAGLGTRIVAVQVRDAAYRVSATAQASVLVTTPPVVSTPTTTGGGTLVLTGTRDTTAPRIVSLLVPRRSCSRRIVLRIGARDDVAVRQVRFAGENGRFGRWTTYRPRMVRYVSRGIGAKVTYVQVRDAWGNVSNLTARRTLLVRCG